MKKVTIDLIAAANSFGITTGGSQIVALIDAMVDDYKDELVISDDTLVKAVQGKVQGLRELRELLTNREELEVQRFKQDGGYTE